MMYSLFPLSMQYDFAEFSNCAASAMSLRYVVDALSDQRRRGRNAGRESATRQNGKVHNVIANAGNFLKRQAQALAQ